MPIDVYTHYPGLMVTHTHKHIQTKPYRVIHTLQNEASPGLMVTHIHIHIHIHIHTYTYTHTHIHIQTHTYIYTHTHIHIHTNTHTYLSPPTVISVRPIESYTHSTVRASPALMVLSWGR